MIRKVEEIMVSPVQEKAIGIDRITDHGKRFVDYIFNRWGALLFIVGFLLGRAVIIGELTPFAVPFLAVLYHLRRERLFLAGCAVVLGSISQELSAPLSILAGMLLFIGLQKMVEFWGKGELSYTPFVVFVAVFIANSSIAFFTEWTGYQLLMITVEASLSLVLTLIFVQSLPLLTTRKRRHALKNEEVVCLVILLASVMTGTVGWMVLDLSMEHILSRYAILVFAFAAGGAIGATVGVVTGIILSLANIEALLQMSLLAFTGLLGGLLREGKKIGVAIGLLVGTILMGFYIGEWNLWMTLNESLIAIMLFLVTPKPLFEMLSKYIPGTQEHAQFHQDYAKRLRDVTAHKVDQFSQVFQQLSQSFSLQQVQNDERKDEYTDLLLSQVAEQTCQVCFKKEQCWQKKMDDTYRLMTQLYEEIEIHGKIKKPHLHGEWTRHCVKSSQVIEIMEQEFEHVKHHLKYKKKVKESRRLVAEQLSGVSQVMNNFAREIQREGEEHQVQEQQILDAFEELGLAIRYVDIISLEEGNVDIEISQPFCHGRDECTKIIAPLLSEIVGEDITVAKKECDFYSDGYCKMSLCSAKAFIIETGISSAAKGGGWLSGDNFNTMDVGNGKYALAISDGMGNGERAHLESNETLTLLQQILQSGIEETVAIKSINSILSLRTTEEVFSTLDLAMIDLQTAKTKFLKIGSTPSFIKRGEQTLTVAAHNLPMGILHEIEVDVVSEQLKAGDLLVMITDGIYDASRDIENKERWMRRIISEIETEDPQEVADILLERVVRFHQGHIMDDMTVVVAKVERNTPEWATISMTGLPSIKRKKKQPLIS